MILKPGKRLRCVVCTTEIIVLAANGDVDIRCGGEPMSADAQPAKREVSLLGTSGTQVGKRYTFGTPGSDSPHAKVLCVVSGEGMLSVADSPFQMEAARPLPASD